MLTLVLQLLPFQVCSWAQGRESTPTWPSAPKLRDRKVRVVKTVWQHMSSSQPAKSVLQLSSSVVTTSGIFQDYQVMEHVLCITQAQQTSVNQRLLVPNGFQWNGEHSSPPQVITSAEPRTQETEHFSQQCIPRPGWWGVTSSSMACETNKSL